MSASYKKYRITQRERRIYFHRDITSTVLNDKQTPFFSSAGSSDSLKIKELHCRSFLNFIDTGIRLRKNKFRLREIIFCLALISFSPSTKYKNALGEIPPIVEEEFQTLLQLFKILLQLLVH